MIDQQASQSQTLTERVDLVHRKALDDSQKQISDSHLEQVQLLLAPFRERLKDFEKKIEDTYGLERSERASLRGELNKMMELNQKMSTEAQQLTRALKGDVKAQGNWGELILENILERSGLRKGEEYFTQGSFKNSEGSTLRPDILVKLPDQKHLIVDSKVSLISYEEYSRAENEELKTRAARAFLESMKRHIDGLSGKSYQALEDLGSPDFVLLFIPLEPAFALLFQLRPEIFSECWDKNIALVSPTTLLTTLRTVASLWRQDRQEKNALEIAKRGGLLYDKFVMLAGELESITEQIDRLQKNHHQVLNRLKEGSGNLFSQVEKLRELGAKSEKRLRIEKAET